MNHQGFNKGIGIIYNITAFQPSDGHHFKNNDPERRYYSDQRDDTSVNASATVKLLLTVATGKTTMTRFVTTYTCTDKISDTTDII